VSTALLSFDNNLLDPRLPRSIWFMGALMTIHAEAADTNGKFALIECVTAPGCEPPLHIHRQEDEMFYVIEGRLKVFRGNEELLLGPGDSGFLPRNVAHTFKILSKQARFLAYITPAGFEEYFRTIGRPAQDLTPEENPPTPDFARMERLAQQLGVSFAR
jgi:quercetin dioxygenase-like cupin family protein